MEYVCERDRETGRREGERKERLRCCLKSIANRPLASMPPYFYSRARCLVAARKECCPPKGKGRDG